VTTNNGSLTVILYVSVVTNTNDSGPGSLRSAIADIVPENFVTFAPNVTGSIALTNGQITVTNSMRILGLGPNTITVSAGTTNRIFFITNAATVRVSGLSFANGNIVSGGAILLGSGTLVIDQCVFTNNAAGAGLGGGGAIYVNAGTLTISNSTFVANRAHQGGAVFSPNPATVTIVNSTFCKNTATNPPSSQSGGAIAYATAGLSSLTLLSCTIVSNTASSQGGGIFKQNAATGTFRNCIIADNTAATGPDLSGAFSSAGYNLIGATNGSSGFTNGVLSDQAGTVAAPLRPKVGPLADNGGPTPTMALLSNSAAIDKGISAGLSTDQRGGTRPLDKAIANASGGDGADIGAFELGGYLRMIGLAPHGNDIDVSFTSDIGNKYALLRSANLRTNSWTVVATNVTGTGLIITVPDAGAVSLPQGFYRAQSLP
jgi:parallel beta-helix repeat protein